MTTGSTLTRAFTGKLEVGDETVPATIRFSDGAVSLLVGDDEVGHWAAGEVDFTPVETGYELRAEGDSIRFTPDEDSFAAHVGDVSSPSPEPQAPTDPDESDAFPVGEVLEPLSVEEGPDLPDEEDDEGEESEEDDEAPLVLEDPDEYFAAGLAGPGSEVPPPRFGSARVEPDAPAAPTDPGETVDADAAVTSQEQESLAADADRLTRPSPAPVPPDPPGEQADGTPEHGDAESRSIAGILRGLRKSAAPEESGDDEPALVHPSDEQDGNRPAPLDDAENVKQWLLVGAGGLVLLALLGVVAWGLISLVGEGDTSVRAAGAPATASPAPTAATVPTSAPTTTPPPTAVPAENREAAEDFVTAWNENAGEYAYHMSIRAEQLPISTAPTSAVHLTYDEEGVLELTLAPEGTDNERDVLVAMGLAVAWADPSLSPEGRKELLAAMGVNVDDPDVSNMGGELERNGVGYSTTVSDGVINFRVAPA